VALVETKTVENSLPITTPVSEIRYQYDNHLGSACLELDTTANMISYEEYHPFGTTSYRSGSSEVEVSLKRYKYVGKERDEETGLYYYGARYYAGWIARFVSVDPLQEKYPELTPFQYASNRPITMIDVDGKEGTLPSSILVQSPKIQNDRIQAESRTQNIAKKFEGIQIVNIGGNLYEQFPMKMDLGEIKPIENPIAKFEFWLEQPSNNLLSSASKLGLNIAYSLINDPFSLVTGKTIGGHFLNSSDKTEAFMNVAPQILSFGFTGTKFIIGIKSTGLKGYNEFISKGKDIGVTLSKDLPIGMKWQTRAKTLFKANTVNQGALNSFKTAHQASGIILETKKEVQKK